PRSGRNHEWSRARLGNRHTCPLPHVMSLADTFVIFELDQAAYGIRSDHVQHVGLLEHITPVPNTAAAVDGVVFSRGQVIPAINLRSRFGLSREEPTPS